MRRKAKLATSREKRQASEARATIAVAVVVLAMFVITIGVVMWLVRTDKPTDSPSKYDVHDSMTVTKTFNGEKIRWYVMIDPDTQVQYLVNDRGGCTPRLDAFGNPKGTQRSDQSEEGFD